MRSVHSSRTSPTTGHQRPSVFGRLPRWAWVVIGLVAVLFAVVLAPLVVLVSLTVLVTAVIGLVRNTPTWLGLSSRRGAVLTVICAAAVLVLSSGVLLSTQHSDKPAASAPVGFAATQPAPSTAAATPSATPTPQAAPTPVVVITEHTVTEPVAFTESTVEDNTIPQGETRVMTVGQNGEIAIVYRVTTVDGIETERIELSRATTIETIGQVIANGTYVPPQTFVGEVEDTTGEGDGCDPKYAEACVPIASDVDCAWGTGDGPAYLDGVARVIGSDIYGLDRDNDGWACERD